MRLDSKPLRPEESALAEMVAEALRRGATVWRDSPGAGGDPGGGWDLAGSFGTVASRPPESAPVDALCEASRADRAVKTPSHRGATTVAMRLGARSDAFVAVEVSPEEADLAVTLVENVAARRRYAETAATLREENDSFASQLASDLEELTFLRSMVERLSSARVDDELVGMAAATLPVLNATVRAECLALLRPRRPSDPYDAEVALVEGGTPTAHATLEAAVLRFGPAAGAQPVVRNWRGAGLPTAAQPAHDADSLDGVRSLVLAPLRSGPRLLGWLAAINRLPSDDGLLERSWQLASDEFGSGEGTLIATTASVLATHAANLDLLREKEQLMVSMVRALVSAIESKDKYTRGHSERVALFTRRIAEEMGYLESDAENLYLSALLHDVGKIGVPDAVLTKEGRLTDEEYAEISRHPDEGWAILCDLEQLRYVLPGVLHHHERWDGRGYPDGLAAEQIPLDGRVMAVADAFDAMTSDRPYRKGMPVERAEAILREGAGVQWDPACVDAYFGCRDEIFRIKEEYQESDRRAREKTAMRDAAQPLVHEVAGTAG